jgi:DNA-binding response OmpR family regulator
MVAPALEHNSRFVRLSLLVSGEAGDYAEALRMIVGPGLIQTHRVQSGGEMLEMVRQGQADAVVLDEEAMHADALKLLRTIRRLNEALLVVMLTCRSDRRWLEECLRLAAFSVVSKPLQLEELLLQIHRMMTRMDESIRRAEW